LSANGPSRGSMGLAAVPTWLPLTPSTRPVIPVPSPIRLLSPLEFRGPSTSSAVVPVAPWKLPAIRVLCTTAGGETNESTNRPPPLEARLSVSVTLVNMIGLICVG